MGSLSQLFKPGLRKALVIGILLALFNQVIGMNAITYYGPEIFKMIGFGQNAGFVTTCIVGVVEVIFTVIAVLLIDKVGRKKLMSIGSAFMAVFMILIGTSFYFHLTSGLMLIFFILGFVAAFCVSVGPITWIMISEIFPNHLRARAAGIATIFLWGAQLGDRAICADDDQLIRPCVYILDLRRHQHSLLSVCIHDLPGNEKQIP